MALIIAGERSGVGKTTVTLSILAFLAQQKNSRIQSFKVGPDYIDPMFHTSITGVAARNLDPILTSPSYVRSCFNLHSATADYTLIEGVMGLFDGVKFPSSSILDYASTAHIARILAIPVLLVLDCAKLSGSIAAIAKGFSLLDPDIQIIGVVLNKVASDRHLELLTEALAQIQMPIFGVLRRYEQISIPDRHLGLIPTVELPELNQIVDKLAHLAKDAFDWHKLLPFLKNNSQSTINNQYAKRYPFGQSANPNKPPKIAVARDRAFNFYYQDNLDLFSELGAEAIFWSPLADRQVPPNVAGFYFGGGFPEVFAEELAANQPILRQLQRLIASNIPVYAECGGLMYLCDRLIDLQGKSWQLVGSIPATTTMQARLKLGYRQILTLDSPLQETNRHDKSSFVNPFPTDYQLWGHEFHRSELITPISHPLWQVRGLGTNSQTRSEGWNLKNIQASYLHFHWGESKFLFTKWLDSCRDYQDQLA